MKSGTEIPQLTPEESKSEMRPAVRRGDFMHLEIVGGDYYGYVEDRFGRELVDVVISRRARWIPALSIIAEESLSTTVEHEQSTVKVLLHFIRANTAGTVFDAWDMEVRPDSQEGDSWAAEIGHSVSRTVHGRIWKKIVNGEPITADSARELTAGCDAIISLKALKDDTGANTEALPPGK